MAETVGAKVEMVGYVEYASDLLLISRVDGQLRVVLSGGAREMASARRNLRRIGRTDGLDRAREELLSER